jgi:hypothetical protein
VQPYLGTVALQAECDALGAAVPGGVGDGLAGDSDERLGAGGRQLDARRHVEPELDPEPLRDLGGRLGQGDLDGLVPRRGQSADGRPQLGLRPLDGRPQPSRRIPVRLAGDQIKVAVNVGQFLCQPVVQVTCHAPAFLGHRCRRKRGPVRPDLSQAADEEGNVEREPENVAGVKHGLRIRSGKQ